MEFNLWQLFLWKIFFISFSNFARYVLYSLQFKRKCSGISFTLQVEHFGEVSVSVLLLWPLSMECPVFWLAILEIHFLEVFSKRMAVSVDFLWDMLPIIFFYFVYFEFSHLLVYLLMENILLPCCIYRVIVGCWVADIFLFSTLFLQVESANFFNT